MNGPWIVPLPPLATGGIDYLGLRQTNLDLMADVVPGLNNVTDNVRPFSLMAWITWKFKQLAVGMPTSEIRAEFERFRDRVEVLFTWSHAENGRRDLRGLQNYAPPIEVDGKAALDFKSWKREPSSTSFFAPVLYGPASKEGLGLGILRSVGPNKPLEPSESGEKLALALDEQLRRSPLYEGLLDRLGIVRATGAEASSLYSLWKIDEPTAAEVEWFRGILIPLETSDQSVQRRRDLARSIIAVLQDNHGARVDEVRAALCAPFGNGGLEHVSDKWLILQLRQAEKISLEALFRLLEYIVLRSGASRSETVARFIEVVSASPLGPSDKGTMSSWESWCLGLWRDKSELRSAIALRSENSPIELTMRIRALVNNDDGQSIASAAGLAFSLVILLSHATTLLGGSSLVVQERLSWGGEIGARDRFSLKALAASVLEYQDKSVGEFIEYLLFDELLSRHMFTASRRADGTSNRLRIATDGDRWTTFAKSPAKVPLTRDRLAALLGLMVDCQLIPREVLGESQVVDSDA